MKAKSSLVNANIPFVVIMFMALAGVLLVLSPATSTAQGQLDCEDPIDESSPRFSISFWTQTDFCKRSVSFQEILSGGPPPDGIPPIDDPQFESIASASEWLVDQSPVIALEINGDARAYPLAIMTWHEIANDVVGDTPVAVTFCPLCNASIVFDRTVNDEVARFGVSGLLRNSDLIMWDDLTQSWWQQFTGTGIVGEFTGHQLEVIPSTVVGFSAFAEQYPDGVVLTRDTGASRSYGLNPYEGYDSRGTPYPFFDRNDIDQRLPVMERVLGGIIGGEGIAYPFAQLADEQVVNDTFAERDIVVFWQPGAVSALDAREIDASRDIGMAAAYSRELDDTTLTFSLTEDGAIVDDQTGSTWNVFGTALEGELEGSQLRQLPFAPHFWFAWAVFQPDAYVYGLEE